MNVFSTTALVLVSFLLQQAACTHLETCECDEIRTIIMVNATVEEAIFKLESKFSLQITNVNQSELTATFEKHLKPIKRQLDYHLPLPPQEGWMRVAYIDMRNLSHQCPI